MIPAMYKTIFESPLSSFEIFYDLTILFIDSTWTASKMYQMLLNANLDNLSKLKYTLVPSELDW